MSTRPHVAPSLARGGPELEHDLAQEERDARVTLCPLRRRPVAGIRSSLGLDAAHGEDHFLAPRPRGDSPGSFLHRRAGPSRSCDGARSPCSHRRRAGHQLAGLLLDPAERRDVVVRAQQDPGLARAGLGREIGLPLDELVRAGREPARHLRRVAVADRPLEHGEREAVDLDEDDAGLVGANLLARASGHPLDHAQRVRVVVVDAESDLEHERRRCSG